MMPVPPNRPIYADYAATTPMDPHVIQSMMAAMQDLQANANPNSTTHYYGRATRAQVETARKTCAKLINAVPSSWIFTSGASESNYIAIRGIAEGYRKQGNHIITFANEHKATLNPIRALGRAGFEVSILPLNEKGDIDLATLRAAITEQTILIAVSAINNETGMMADLAGIAALSQAHGIHWHVDAAQAYGKVAIDVEALGCSTLSASAHKIYGPKGIGGLYIRQKPKVRLADILNGGTMGIRPGTQAPPLIIGFAAAAKIAATQQHDDIHHILALRERLIDGLHDMLGGRVSVIELPERQYPGIISIRFHGVNNVGLMQLLTDHMAFSAGSACNTTNPEPSHVLSALGLSDRAVLEIVRISLGRMTSGAQIDRMVEALVAAANLLRYIEAPEAPVT